MSFIYNRSTASGGGSVGTLTGNAGGIVGPTAGNINIVGAGGVTVTGNPGTHTLVITDTGSLRSTTYVSTTPHVVLATEDVLLVDTTTIAAASSIKLPNAPTIDGQEWTIKDWSGSAATFPITVTTVGGAVTIDGATTFVLNKAYESITVVWSVAEGTYSIVSEVGVTGGIVTINGDAGSITGTTVTIKSGLSTNNAGETVDFTGAATTLTFNVTDGNSNTTIGSLAGKAGMSGTSNSGFGALSLGAITSGIDNTAAGYGSLSSITSDSSNSAFGFTAASSIVGGNHNTAVGAAALTSAVAASYNTAVGYNAGSAYTTNESSNISINSVGVITESNTLRIGAGTGAGTQQLTSAYISGIKGVNVGSTANVVTNTGATDQLGTALLTAGAGITITPTANAITIAAAGSTTYISTTPYVVLTTDHTILVDTVAIGTGSVVRLPNAPAIDGETWTVKDWSGGAASFNITVTTPGGTDTIDGATTFVIASSYESITVVWSLSKGTYSIVSEVDGPITLNGDSGSATGNPVTVKAGMTASGSSVRFTGTGSTLTLKVTDTNSNTIMGGSSGGVAISGNDNVGLGAGEFNALTSGSRNVAMGDSSLSAITADTDNTAIGNTAMGNLNGGSFNTAVGSNVLRHVGISGSYNLALGYEAGINFTGGESSNVLLNNLGVVADNNVLRIGAGTGAGSQQLAKAYISGIDAVNVGSVSKVVTMASDQLGTATLTAGAGIVITPTANVITIATIDAATSTVFTAANPYTVLTTNDVILVDTATIAAPTIVKLINAPLIDGQRWTIKDATGSAGSGDTITIQSISGAVNIDNATTFVMSTAFQSVTVVWSLSKAQYYLI